MPLTWTQLGYGLMTYSEKSERAMRILEQGFDDAVVVMSIPEKYRKRLRTTQFFLQGETLHWIAKSVSVQKTPK